MTDPDRPAGHLALAVRWAGRLLCWSLAAAWSAAAVDLTVPPQAGWWDTLWPLPWFLTCACAVAWAALRAREKSRAGGHDPQTEMDVRADWDQAA
ncbi:hypothetical protein M2160_003392 [Streptomyces sp. SAI-117]|uniref:hypothetical protein n=1 Tax=Streptomyces sp. SAI-117 TaxID=2940546 RepID=UPI002475F3C0|nr:hypothetical protein [Streptomyces sp. SAI-117]MDH6568371.1 hypothetical protein [Streptomyces sp. SAI-117]